MNMTLLIVSATAMAVMLLLNWLPGARANATSNTKLIGPFTPPVKI